MSPFSHFSISSKKKNSMVGRSCLVPFDSSQSPLVLVSVIHKSQVLTCRNRKLVNNNNNITKLLLIESIERRANRHKLSP